MLIDKYLSITDKTPAGRAFGGQEEAERDKWSGERDGRKKAV